MLKRLIGLSLVASLGLAGTALAQTTSTSSSGSQETNQSNPSGLGQSMSVDFQNAGGCCSSYYDHKNANGNADALAKHFSQKLAAMQLAIIEAMRLSTGQLSGNLREQSGAEHTLADQQDDRATVKSVEQVRIEAIRQAASGTTSCRVITGTRGGNIVQQANSAANMVQSGWLNWLAGDTSASKDGQRAATFRRLEAHCKYATKGDVEAGLCEQEGEKPSADVNAGQSIFFKESGLVSAQTPDTMAASQLFLINTMTPYTITPIDPQLAHTDESKNQAAKNITYTSRQSVATEYMAEFLGRRTPSTDNKLTGWADELAKKMQGYDEANFSRNGMSLHDWMKIMSKNFMLDDTAMTGSDKDIPVAVKDIKNMMAVNTYMNFETYELLERMGVILAHQLAIMNDNTRNDIIAPRNGRGTAN